MKALSMPISSPGRSEKFPPPLKRYSRTNAGSRSKSSPIFYRRNAAGKFEAAQEPYSPKVTCIGQVRAGKSGGGYRRRRCWFVKRAMFFSRLYRWRRAFRRILGKWVLFFKADYCKKVDAEKDCLSHGRKIKFLSGKCENLEIRVRENEGGGGDDSPPRNALSLTRFAASLGERILREKGEKCEELKSPVVSEDTVAESRIRQDSTRNHLGDLEGNYLVLARCKSEPARRGKLMV